MDVSAGRGVVPSICWVWLGPKQDDMARVPADLDI